MARRKARRGRKGRATSSLAQVSIEELHGELERRRRAAGPLLKRRTLLANKLASMDAHLAALGLSGDDPAPRRGRAAKAGRPRRGAATGARRGRPPRDGLSLVDRLHQVLAGKEMGVSEAGQAVLDSGYKTASKNFRTVINQTLLSNKDRFRKVSRGIYTAK